MIIWLSWKLLNFKNRLFLGTTLFSLLGVVLGVACLVVSMAVVSGFEQTLQNSIIDVTGHMQIVRRSGANENFEQAYEKISQVLPEPKMMSKFSFVTGIMARSGKLSGVVLQGVDPQTGRSVLNFDKRLKKGKALLETKLVDGRKVYTAMIGKGLAEKMQLQIGDVTKVVLPVAQDLDPSQFQRRMADFEIVGILDLGKYDFDQRMLITSLTATQELANLGSGYHGVLVKLSSAQQALELSPKIEKELGQFYWIKNWREMSENLFSAIQTEKAVIFFVVLLIVLAASLNASSNLYIHVVQRFKEMALLKALGLSEKKVRQVFILQGMILSSMGLLGGILVGFLFCLIFEWAESYFQLIPGDVYKIDHIQLRWNPWDLVMIICMTLLMSFISTLAPSRKGSKMETVQGLKSE